jgi:hypothetical protein
VDSARSRADLLDSREVDRQCGDNELDRGQKPEALEQACEPHRRERRSGRCVLHAFRGRERHEGPRRRVVDDLGCERLATLRGGAIPAPVEPGGARFW